MKSKKLKSVLKRGLGVLHFCVCAAEEGERLLQPIAYGSG